MYCPLSQPRKFPFTPAVVLAEVGAAVIPVAVPLASAMFSVPSLAADCVRVKMMSVVVPPIVKNAAMVGLAASAARTLAAHTDGKSPLVTFGVKTIGEPAIPAAVTVTDAVPSEATVPAAVAVST